MDSGAGSGSGDSADGDHAGRAADWWSAGVLAMELATGRYLTDLHPSGRLRAHTPPEIPDLEDPDLASLLSGLLHPSPGSRIGDDGVRAHPFFKGVDWGAV